MSDTLVDHGALPSHLESIVSQLSEVELEYVKEIQKWLFSLAVNSDFNPRTDDDFVLKFLLGCKFDMGKTKTKINRYYQLRKKYPQWYKNRNVYEDEVLLGYTTRGIISTSFDKLDDKGRPVIIINLSRLLPTDDVYVLLRLSVIMVDSMLLHPEVQQHGVVFVLDVSNIPFPVLAQSNPKFLYRFIKCVLMGMPLRVKAMHFINVNQAVMAILKTFKLFLTEKLKKRVHVYGKRWDSLFDEVPRHCIANEYGGTGGTFLENFEKLEKDFDKVCEYMKDDEQYGYMS